MKKNRRSGFCASVIAVLLITAFFSITAFAGTWSVDELQTATGGSWVYDGIGWRYLNDDGTYQDPCWLDVGDERYRLDDNGYRVTGWYAEDIGSNHAGIYFNYYYFSPTGELQTGWLNDNGNWYFLNNKKNTFLDYGRRAGGMAEIDHYFYYFDPDTGILQTNTTYMDTFYFGDDGRRLNADGTPYYANNTYGYFTK